MARAELMVCVNLRFGERPSCAARGSVALYEELERRIRDEGLEVKMTRSVCQNQCVEGPGMRLLPGPEVFKHVGAETTLDHIMDRVRRVAEPVSDFPSPV